MDILALKHFNVRLPIVKLDEITYFPPNQSIISYLTIKVKPIFAIDFLFNERIIDYQEVVCLVFVESFGMASQKVKTTAVIFGAIGVKTLLKDYQH